MNVLPSTDCDSRGFVPGTLLKLMIGLDLRIFKQDRMHFRKMLPGILDHVDKGEFHGKGIAAVVCGQKKTIES